jgi:hypothetical protein
MAKTAKLPNDLKQQNSPLYKQEGRRKKKIHEKPNMTIL